MTRDQQIALDFQRAQERFWKDSQPYFDQLQRVQAASFVGYRMTYVGDAVSLEPIYSEVGQALIKLKCFWMRLEKFIPRQVFQLHQFKRLLKKLQNEPPQTLSLDPLTFSRSSSLFDHQRYNYTDMKTLLLNEDEFEFIKFLMNEASTNLQLIDNSPMSKIIKELGELAPFLDERQKHEFYELKRNSESHNRKTKEMILSIRTKCEVASSSDNSN